jgi:hypothetical protein
VFFKFVSMQFAVLGYCSSRDLYSVTVMQNTFCVAALDFSKCGSEII